MSQTGWTAVDDYLVDALLEADSVLDAALADSDAAGLPQIAVAPNQGKLLMLLAQTCGARRILEIGTLGGYSTIWLARALPAAEPFARKRGFTVPVAEWIAAAGAKLGPLVAQQPGIVELCRPKAVEALFRSSGKHHGFAAWTLLFYALWHQHHICGKATDGDVFAALSA